MFASPNIHEHNQIYSEKSWKQSGYFLQFAVAFHIHEPIHFIVIFWSLLVCTQNFCKVVKASVLEPVWLVKYENSNRNEAELILAILWGNGLLLLFLLLWWRQQRSHPSTLVVWWWNGKCDLSMSKLELFDFAYEFNIFPLKWNEKKK